MPQEVLNQIKWLCKEIPKVEWSGILFYSIEGSIKDPKNLVVHLQDILPMQKGTATYTEYELDDSVVEYMMDNETMEKGWKMGHIHSHNTMNVYFSGTDWSELEDNAPNHNFYVSLIVNNFMDFCAKVCFIAETKTADLTARDENGIKYTYQAKEPTVEEKLIVYDFDIHSPANIIEVSEGFESKVKGIIEKAEKKVYSQQYNVWKGGKTSDTTHVGKHQVTPRVEKRPSLGASWGKEEFQFTNPMLEEADDEIEIEIIEEFTQLAINTGNDVTKYKDLEEILDMYREFNITPNALAKGVLDKYVSVYNKYFDFSTSKDDPDFFKEITEEVIQELEGEAYTTTNRENSALLHAVIFGLKNMLNKFSKYEFGTI